MNIIDIITKKRDNLELTYDELDYAFNSYLDKEIPDYQMSALLMAITINGLTLRETIDLTDIFVKSGDVYKFKKKVADKHSTGGVGDTTTLIINPIVASLNVPMVKMSGRGLGITGGTADKLEAIPGFEMDLTKEEIETLIKTVGVAQCTQSDRIVPLDKVIYALRDITGTTKSMPLIASSIMSKKIACGATYIVIDIKYGEAAFMKTIDDANKLSDWMIKIGDHFGLKIKTLITSMDTPLGSAIGNALEVQEAINVLKGKKGRLYDVSVEIASHLVSLAKNLSISQAEVLVKNTIEKGQAYKIFEKWIKAQNGRLNEMYISDKVIDVRSNEKGTIENISEANCGRLAIKLGAGRETKEDEINHSVGIKLLKTEGDYVETGDILAELYVDNYDIELTDEDLKLFMIRP